MKSKKQTTESVHHEENWAQATYRTGSTQPPKSHGGIIAFLLVLVIFLSGIVTALSMMNIRLFRELSAMEQTESSPVVFSRGSMDMPHENAQKYPLGFAGQEVSDFWQIYHDLPAGIYVVEITDGSASGLLPGDVLTAIDGTALQSAQDFHTVLQNYQPGDHLEALLYRDGKEISITLTMENEEN